MIALNQVNKTYSPKKIPAVPAVCDVSLNVEKGEFVVITGRSGSGKTTLLNLIAGLARPTHGQVMIDGVDLWSLSDAKQSHLRNRMMGFVFQFTSLLSSLTVLENVTLPTILDGTSNKQETGIRARSLLDQVGLADKLSAYPRHLSAGQQQRVVLARALINQPQLLLADEPTSNLDEQTEREIMALIQEIHSTSGITILLVTHSGQLVPRGTRAVHMSAGSIVRDEVYLSEMTRVQ